MSFIEHYPQIRRAFLEMSYCNGGIYAARTELDALKACDEALAVTDFEVEQLQALDAWIGTLSDEQVQVLVDGESEAMDAIARQGPLDAEGAPISNLFNDLFDVC